MELLTKETLMSDVELRHGSSNCWGLNAKSPDIRQIYGHFLPPQHMQIVDGLVAKDFNFPAAYHRVICTCTLDELHALGTKLSADSVCIVADSVDIREESDGAILYTSYHNGFYVNDLGRKILEQCQKAVSLGSIARQLSLKCSQVLEFIARTMTIGVVQIHAA